MVAYRSLLQQFERELENMIGRPTDLRPFVCDGSPLECQVFIIGFNPATEMARSFWEFWQPGYGFRQHDWLEAYKEARRAKRTISGIRRRPELSNTRRVLAWITGAALPVKCLETNIFARPTARASQLEKANRDTSVFDFLLESIQPKVTVTHGKDAAKHIEFVLGAAFPHSELAEVATTKGKVRGMSVPHFARGWSQERALELGQDLREAVLT